jgi:AbrB family looped-hinge helix DNA binding protein
MTTVKISPKYQVVIPKEIRRRMKIKPGQRLQVVQISNKLEFMPIKDIKETRGFLKGIDTNIEREGDRI